MRVFVLPCERAGLRDGVVDIVGGGRCCHVTRGDRWSGEVSLIVFTKAESPTEEGAHDVEVWIRDQDGRAITSRSLAQRVVLRSLESVVSRFVIPASLKIGKYEIAARVGKVMDTHSFFVTDEAGTGLR